MSESSYSNGESPSYSRRTQSRSSESPSVTESPSYATRTRSNESSIKQTSSTPSSLVTKTTDTKPLNKSARKALYKSRVGASTQATELMNTINDISTANDDFTP